MHTRFSSAAVAAVLCLLFAASAQAQDWKGMGRVAGKVVDEAGKPIAGVIIKAALPAADNRGPEDSRTNDKGDWAIGGLNAGTWALDFIKEGYETRRIALNVSEIARLRPMEVVLKKVVVVVDPNEVIKTKLTEAAALMNEKKFAEARAIYEQLQAAHPEVKQFTPLIARSYYGEGDKDKAIALLREAVAADAANVEVRMLLGNLLMETGKGDEAKTVMASIDTSKVSDPVILLNMGIGLINEGKQDEAIVWFDKAIAAFPDNPDAYYYRGLSYLATGKQAEAKADLEKFVAIAPADSPELATARKILESIK